MRKILFIINLLFISVISSFGQNVDIGLFDHKKIEKAFIEPIDGKYKVFADGKKMYSLRSGRYLFVESKNGNVLLSTDKELGLFKQISIEKREQNWFARIFSKKEIKNVLHLKLDGQKSRIYDGNILISIQSDFLQLINHVDLDDYLAGVVEAESGTKAKPEYCKAQSTICRTNVTRNFDRHRSEGFSLCDGVHCQAYKGRSEGNIEIQKAIEITENEVIISKTGKLIDAVFYANSGGETANSEDVWVGNVEYLRGKTDSFSLEQRQTYWTKSIPVATWKKFLIDKGLRVQQNALPESFNFEQKHRVKYYTYDKQNIKLTTIRYGLKLRSTFFSVKAKGNNLIISGRGYGHGVGMSQEGAMNMAILGYGYQDIIKFYYKNVTVQKRAEFLTKFKK